MTDIGFSWVMTSRRQSRRDGHDPGVGFYIGSVRVAEVLFTANPERFYLSIDCPSAKRYHSSVSEAMREMHRVLKLPLAEKETS